MRYRTKLVMPIQWVSVDITCQSAISELVLVEVLNRTSEFVSFRVLYESGALFDPTIFSTPTAIFNKRTITEREYQLQFLNSLIDV